MAARSGADRVERLQLHDGVYNHFLCYRVGVNAHVDALQRLLRNGLEVSRLRMNIGKARRKPHRTVKGKYLVTLLELPVRREQNEDAVSDDLTVQVVVLLRALQNRKAVVDRVRETRCVIDLHEIRDEARGDNDAENNLGQLVGNRVGAAVAQRLLAPAEHRRGAHGGVSLREETVHS